MTDLSKPLLFTKEHFLGERPIFSNVCVCEALYTNKRTLSDLHVHEFIEFSLVVSGTGIHRIWNDVLECKKGDVFILNTGVPHCYFAANSKERPTVLNVLFDTKILGEEFSNHDGENFCYGVFKNSPLISNLKFVGEDYKKIHELCTAIAKEIEEKSKFSLELAISKLKELLITFSRANPSSDNQASENIKENSLASKAIRIILDNFYKQDFTLDKLSSMLFVSKAHLSRLLFRAGGEHFADYVKNLRIKRAANLLVNTDLSNGQIVFQCGLKDIPTFYKAFKNAYGLTPKQYRIKNSKKD